MIVVALSLDVCYVCGELREGSVGRCMVVVVVAVEVDSFFFLSIFFVSFHDGEGLG